MRDVRRAAWLGWMLAGMLAGTARAACDPAGADAAALAASRAAIDAACPCDGPARREYRTCANAAVAGEVAAGRLPPACRREALRYPRRSRCGRPGAVVCCRIGASGRDRHRVASDVAHCRPPSGGSACVSAYQSLVTGCDASGCVSPVCGNGVVEPGEACDPPGTGTCDRFCQPAACPAAPPGEVLLACLDGAPRLGVASNGGGYLATWDAHLRREVPDVLARRLGLDGAPLDAGPLVVSEDVPAAVHGSPAVDAAGADYAVAWYATESLPPSAVAQEIFAREIAADGVPTGPSVQLARNVPFGMCQTSWGAPLATAALGAHRYAALWRMVGACLWQGVIFEDPTGVVSTLPAGAPVVGLPLGLWTIPPPLVVSSGPATIDALGGDALAAWPVSVLSSTTPPDVVARYLAGAWVDASGGVAKFSLGPAEWAAGFGPTVAAGGAGFLVAWADWLDGALVEVRGRRVTRADGPLDGDGGLLLATAGGGIAGGPAVAFDGSAWVVVWLEASAAGYDLRAVAVGTDGSVVDPVPRLLASGVAATTPAVASAGTGDAVVLFGRAHPGGITAVHALATPGG